MAARIVCIIGSTGTGKSALAISLAERFNGEIINADAMQCYIGLPISTNKPTIIEMKGIPHHLINFLPPPNTRNDHFMVLDYIRLADEVIDGIIKRGRLPIIVGGTHYYIEALLKRDFDSIQQENDEDEDKIKEQPKKDEKHEYESIKSDSFTIIKKDFPSQDERKRPQLDRHLDIKPLLKGGRFPYNSLVLWLSSESDINRLGQKLDERVDAMIERGLQNEIMSFWNESGFSQENIDKKELQEQNEEVIPIQQNLFDHTIGICQAIGLKEFREYLQQYSKQAENSIEKEQSFQEGAIKLKQATRKYAHKQVQFIKSKLLPHENDEIFQQKLPYIVIKIDIFNPSINITLQETRLCSLIECSVQFLNSFLFQPSLIPLPSILQHNAIWQQDHERIQFLLHQTQGVGKHDQITCEICQKTVIGISEWEAHLQSRQHRRMKKKKNEPKRQKQDSENQDIEEETYDIGIGEIKPIE